jgi:hypothetical protein
MMHHTSSIGMKKQSGYILLITILIIGAIASAILSSLLLLGISSTQVSFSVQQSEEALAAAQACAEYALLKLRQSPSYAGSEFRTVGSYTCEVLAIGGIGNNNRALCTEGTSGDAIRRLEIAVNQILPQTKVFSWQEVSVFTLCQ